jgi:hypothetical protein
MAGEYSVFISHVEEDSELALAITERLEGQGYSTWYYERDCIPGISYLVQTGAAIENCEVFLLIISKDSLSSHQIDVEIERAHEESKPIIPLRLGISHPEFQNRRPLWKQVIGTTASIEVERGKVELAVKRITSALRQMGIPIGDVPLAKVAPGQGPIQGRVCDSCKAPLKEGEKACSNCGSTRNEPTQSLKQASDSGPEGSPDRSGTIALAVESPLPNHPTDGSVHFKSDPFPFGVDAETPGTPQRFCRFCGSPFVQEARKCGMCGKPRESMKAARIVLESLGFVVYADGYVVDPATKLLWQLTDDGVKRDYQESLDYCHNLKLGGYSDWRLPRKEELKRLFWLKFDDLQQLFPGIQKERYWALTTLDEVAWSGESNGKIAFTLDFDPRSSNFGQEVTYFKIYKYYVKAVRSYR